MKNMNKISVLVISLLSVALISCGGSTSKSMEEKEPVTDAAQDTLSAEIPVEADILKNFEIFVNAEVAKLEKSPTAETISESTKAATNFVAKYGDLNALDLTADAQKKLLDLRTQYDLAMANAVKQTAKK